MASSRHQTQTLQGETVLPDYTPSIQNLLPYLKSYNSGNDWIRPPPCPALSLLPNFAVRVVDDRTTELRGIHIRYRPHKDRAILNLPLHKEHIPGTQFRRYNRVAVILRDPTRNAVIDTGTHSIISAHRSTGRCYITLNYTATQYLKYNYQLHHTRLIDNPHLTILLQPGNRANRTGPPNITKPWMQNDIYQRHGLLEPTIHHLGYDTIIQADVEFHGTGTHRPDVFIIAANTSPDNITTRHKILIEGKACHQRSAHHFVKEAAIQLLYHRFANYDHKDAAEGIISIPCEVNKPKWDTIVQAIHGTESLRYTRHVRKMMQKLRNRSDIDKQRSWYRDHLHLHNIKVINNLANFLPLSDRKAIKELIHQIRWV